MARTLVVALCLLALCVGAIAPISPTDGGKTPGCTDSLSARGIVVSGSEDVVTTLSVICQDFLDLGDWDLFYSHDCADCDALEANGDPRYSTYNCGGDYWCMYNPCSGSRGVEEVEDWKTPGGSLCGQSEISIKMLAGKPVTLSADPKMIKDGKMISYNGDLRINGRTLKGGTVKVQLCGNWGSRGSIVCDAVGEIGSSYRGPLPFPNKRSTAPTLVKLTATTNDELRILGMGDSCDVYPLPRNGQREPTCSTRPKSTPQDTCAIGQ